MSLRKFPFNVVWDNTNLDYSLLVYTSSFRLPHKHICYSHHLWEYRLFQRRIVYHLSNICYL